MKEILSINLKDAPVLGATAKAYLRGELDSLISFTPDVKGFEKAIAHRFNFSVNRKVLVDILKIQNSTAGEKSLKNIDLLLNENTFTVTTGHQLCLFTGPLYFIYKILHAIKLSEELKKQFPKDNFVPVYWMASEDHDFAEVNHAYVFGKKLEWNADVRGAVGRTPLSFGNLPLERGEAANTFRFLLEDLKAILGDSPKAAEIYSVIEKCYAELNLAEATRKLVHYLFADYGLIVIDADHPQLKSLFKETMKKELTEQFVLPEVEENSKVLENKGLKVQVTPREINLFYLAENFRERIIKEGTEYYTADQSKKWTQEEIIKELDSQPENFSPNVLMRAMYQETLLPNITYIGGGGEISYWLQMKKMFEKANIFFPVLTVRNSFLLVDVNQMEKWKKLGFEINDLFKSEEELVKEFVSKNASVEIEFKKEQEELISIYQIISEKLAKADATLKASGEAELQKALKSLEMLEAKMRKAEKQKHEQSLNQIRQIKGKLFPEGEWQERRDNFLGYWTKSEGLINKLKCTEFSLHSQLYILNY